MTPDHSPPLPRDPHQDSLSERVGRKAARVEQQAGRRCGRQRFNKTRRSPFAINHQSCPNWRCPLPMEEEAVWPVHNAGRERPPCIFNERKLLISWTILLLGILSDAASDLISCISRARGIHLLREVPSNELKPSPGKPNPAST